jgi:TolA-binding protein
MSEEHPTQGRALRKQGEEAIGKLAQEFLQNPVVTGALSTVFETRERATRAQEVAMSALNLPSAADIERLTRRIRSVSQRIEGLEDGIDRLGDRFEKSAAAKKLEDRLSAIETMLARIEAGLATNAAPDDAASDPADPVATAAKAAALAQVIAEREDSPEE